MKVIIEDIGSLTDSREMLESKPHPIISIFILILILALVVVIIWAYFGEVDEYVKAPGSVRPNGSIYKIKNIVNGNVKDVLCEEGKMVKAKDLLFSIDHQKLDLEYEKAQIDFIETQDEYKNKTLLRQSILDNRNYFAGESSNQEYYNKYNQYEIDMQDQLQQIKSTQTTLEVKVTELEKTKTALETLKDSIIKEKNLFTDADNEYYKKYENYAIDLQKLNSDIKIKSEDYKATQELFSIEAVSKQQLKEAEYQLHNAEQVLQKYKNEFIKGVISDLKSNNEILNENKTNLENVKKNYSVNSSKSHNNEIYIKKIKVDSLVKLDDEISLLKKQLEQYKNQCESLKSMIDDCYVRSPADGIVSVITEINRQEFLQSGEQILNIVPKNDSKLKVQLYVSNKDIANIKEGQIVKLHFLALPYTEYGELSGKIINIGADARQEGGSSYYLVDAEVENDVLYSYKDDAAIVKVGMVCEARVIIRTKKILHYIFEKMNLID